ncbi:BnaA04g16960D [Brassica napus]|uniref:BnaA04g16960D protein n=1 Tax=Brassica napus TaxID=3708 RepID=A0A078GZ54_BRANA|nr:BnaA04g16960D [Brassica napus]
MDHSDESLPPLPLPPRMFALGEEPEGVRVTPYHKPTSIRKILNALGPDEVRRIKETPFGKLVEIADKPPYSGRFGRFLISRQLKVGKKNEVWFIFAGKPVRFSIREFALVTGLNCRNFPPRTKKKSSKNLIEKPYWGELFGSMREVPVSYVISMLKKKTVADTETRIKYALLALLSAVILPTSHNPKILEQHAEKIKDIDQFLAYPWGRVSFEMLISSIKERDEVSLSQKTIALKGFVLSIQLVLIEATPSLTRVVQSGSSSGSELDCEDDDDFVDDDTERKKCINPARVRDIDSSSKTHVVSIISDGVELDNVEDENHIPGDEEDILVANLEKCIHDGFSFRKSHFLGGATLADVIRMREEAAKENNTRKKNKRSVNANSSDAADPDYVVSILKSSLSADLCRMEEEIKNLGQMFTKSQSQMRSYIQDMFDTFQRNISNMIPTPSSGRHADPPHAQQAETTFSREKTTTEPNPGAPPNVPVATASHKRNKSTGRTGHFDPCGTIQDAIHFADHVAPLSGDVNMGDGSLNEEGSPEKCNDGNNDLNPREEQVHPAYSSADGEAREAEEEDPEDAVDMINSPPLTQPAPLDLTEHANITTAGTGGSHAESAKVTSSTSSDSNPPTPNVIPQPSSCLDNAQSNLAFPKPTFSLGLTQEERYLSKTDLVDADESLEEGASISLNDDQEPFPANRKSKRQKVVPRSLVGDYQCDKRFLTRAWEAHVNAIHRGPVIDYAAKAGALAEKLQKEFVIDVSGQSLDSSDLSAILARSSHLTAKVMDVLIHHTRSLIEALSEERQPSSVVLLDTRFVSLLSETFVKFSKCAKKESYRFPAALLQYLCVGCPITEATRIYFPFNFDKKHWVGVCLDCSLSKVVVLDCNTSLRTDGMINKEIRPISEMFPFLLRRAARQVFSKNPKALTIERPRLDLCKCITPDVLDVEAQKTAVIVYEENVGVL